jgi:membrane protease YdiL (CAAX protease family)
MIDRDLWEKESSRDDLHGDWPPYMVLIFTLVLALFSVIIGGALTLAWSQWSGTSVEDVLANLSEDSSSSERNQIRLVAAINQLFTFLIPAFVAAYLIARTEWKGFLGLHNFISQRTLTLSVLFIVVAFPIAQLVYWLNQQIELPQWMMELEESTNNTIQYLLLTDSPLELLQNIILIGIIPAVGEEFLFRGIIQRQLSRWSDRPVLAIWITAILFSAIHMQFQGFFPRVLLGAILGYLLFWTQNLWAPIAAHFVNNTFQVLLQFFFREELSEAELDQVGQLPEQLPASFWFMLPVSIFLTLYIGNKLYRMRKGDG